MPFPPFFEWRGHKKKQKKNKQNNPISNACMVTFSHVPAEAADDKLIIPTLFEEKTGILLYPTSICPAGRPSVRLPSVCPSVMSHHCF